MQRFVRRETRSVAFPHQFLIVSTNRTTYQIDTTMGEAAQWCQEQFGPVKAGGWNRSMSTIFFSDADAAFAFKMRWC